LISPIFFNFCGERTEQLPITTRLTPHIILKAVHGISTFDISTFCYGKIDNKRYPGCGGDRIKNNTCFNHQLSLLFAIEIEPYFEKSNVREMMRLGFIGTGAITEALVTGLCTTQQVANLIWVSPRNNQKSKQLQKKFPHVKIGQSNQNVVDNSDVIVLAFLPKDRDQILQSLEFKEDQILVSLLSGTKNSQVAAQLNRQCTVVRAVPLPCVAEHIGPIVLYPDNEIISTIFNVLGTVVTVDEEEQLEYLSVITSLMAPYFEMLGCITDWATQVGVDQKQAADYIASMFEALSVLAQKSPTGDLHRLADESMTPGGLNELARKIIHDSGGYDYLNTALQAVTNRVITTSHNEREK
jgi:pyrroline-5-carboxylate reductase